MYVDNLIVRLLAPSNPTITLGAEESQGSAPQWSANATKINAPQAYNNTGYTFGFQITWAKADNSTFTLGRPSGASTAYTKLTTIAVANNSGGVYWINFTQNQLGSAGTYNFSWTGWNNSGSNTTSTWNYVINKVGTTINLTINGTNGNVAYTYPTVANMTAWVANGGSGLILYRNGTNVGNQTLQLAAKVWNYTAALNPENYSAAQVERIVTIAQAGSGLSLTSSSGWTITEGTATTITCSETTPYSATLKRDGVTISSPYTALLSSGFYSFNCAFSDGENYTSNSTSNTLNIIVGGVGCTDNSTFTYRATIGGGMPQTALNFTNLVNQFYVRSDMNDVLLNTSNASINKSITGGEYFVLVNSQNVSSFDLFFGNYHINRSLVNGTRTNSTATNFSYSQSSPYYYQFNLIDEMSGAKMNPPAANTTSLAIYCSGGATDIAVNHTQFTVAANRQLTQAEYVVRYSATEIYYRDLLISNPIESKNFYLVDANAYQVIQILMQLQDNTLTFTSPRLHIKKLIGNSTVTITEKPFDVENKVIVYLTNGQQYQISATSGSQERIIGNLFIDTVNLIKTVVINPTTSTNTSGGNTSFSLTWNNQTGLISFVWKDTGANTLSAEMWVYNFSNQTQLLFYGNASNATDISISYIVPDANQTYLTRVSVHNSVLGTSTFSLVSIFTGIASLPFAMLPILPVQTMLFISALGILTVPMLFGPVHGKTAGVIAAFFALLLGVMGFYPVSIVLIAVAVVLAIINKLTESKQEG